MGEFLSQRPGIIFALLLLALAEFGWRTRIARIGYDMRASLASLGVAAGGALIKPLTAGVTASVFLWLQPYALFPMAPGDWRVWLAGFIAVEFTYYWFHRWSHLINWLWASHAVHHSATELTLPAAVRLGWTGLISGGWLLFVPLVIIGFPPLMVAALLAANLLFQYGLHTEAVGRLGFLEYIFNTPSHHRAHHASDKEWLDCNFGGVLIVFDRIFGTFVPEPAGGGLHYGLVKPLISNNPLRIALQTWIDLATSFRRATTWRARGKVLFGRPSA